VDFLLHDFGRLVKKVRVKSHDRPGDKILREGHSGLYSRDSNRWFGDAKRPLGVPAGAIPTVDFLLARPAAIVKKMPVKN
jgi:hypothetical protein